MASGGILSQIQKAVSGGSRRRSRAGSRRTRKGGARPMGGSRRRSRSAGSRRRSRRGGSRMMGGSRQGGSPGPVPEGMTGGKRRRNRKSRKNH